MLSIVKPPNFHQRFQKNKQAENKASPRRQLWQTADKQKDQMESDCLWFIFVS